MSAALVIRDVTVRQVAVPLRRPLATRVGDFARWPLLLIDIRTEQGITGHGYLGPYLDTAAASVRTMVTELGEALGGHLAAPAAAGHEALELLAEGGFTGLKVRIGRASAADDLAAVRKVRDAIGGGVTLVADYNQGLDLGEALLRCRGLDGEGLAWIEEPLRFGGVTGWLQAAAIADTSGLPMSSHLYPEVSGHLLGVTPTRHWLEWQDWAHPVLARPFEVRDGLLHLPEVPGTGLAWDEDAVAHYQAGS